MENEVKETKTEEKKEKKEKKKGKGSVVVIIILIVAVLGLVGYIAYDKGIILSDKKETNDSTEKDIKDDSSNNKKETTKDIALDDSRFIDIYEKIKSYSYNMNRENGYKSFQDRELAKIAIEDFTESDFTKTSEKDKESGYNYYSFKGETMIKYLKKYFSSDVTLDKTKLSDFFVAANVNFDGSGMQTKSYDESSDTYKVIFGGIGWTSGPSPKITTTKIVSAKEKGDTIIVEEKAIYISESSHNDDMYYNIYSDPLKNYNIDGKHFTVPTIQNEKIDVNDYLDKASTITYTFKLNKDTNKYYFVSSSIK